MILLKPKVFKYNSVESRQLSQKSEKAYWFLVSLVILLLKKSSGGGEATVPRSHAGCGGLSEGSCNNRAEMTLQSREGHFEFTKKTKDGKVEEGQG